MIYTFIYCEYHSEAPVAHSCKRWWMYIRDQFVATRPNDKKENKKKKKNTWRVLQKYTLIVTSEHLWFSRIWSDETLYAVYRRVDETIRELQRTSFIAGHIYIYTERFIYDSMNWVSISSLRSYYVLNRHQEVHRIDSQN